MIRVMSRLFLYGRFPFLHHHVLVLAEGQHLGSQIKDADQDRDKSGKRDGGRDANWNAAAEEKEKLEETEAEVKRLLRENKSLQQALERR